MAMIIREAIRDESVPPCPTLLSLGGGSTIV
jgi:hypothetical protein